MTKTALQQLIEENSGKGTKPGIRSPRKSRPVVTFLAVFLVPVLLTLAVLEACDANRSFRATEADIYSDAGKQYAWTELGKKNISSVLKDPESARFRNVYFSAGIADGKRVPVTCGEVNAKNMLGGYSGFQRFISASAAISVLETQVQGFDTLWLELCSIKGEENQPK